MHDQGNSTPYNYAFVLNFQITTNFNRSEQLSYGLCEETCADDDDNHVYYTCANCSAGPGPRPHNEVASTRRIVSEHGLRLCGIFLNPKVFTFPNAGFPTWPTVFERCLRSVIIHCRNYPPSKHHTQRRIWYKVPTHFLSDFQVYACNYATTYILMHR